MLLKDNIPFSYVFGKIKIEILVTLLYSSGVVWLYDIFNWKYEMNLSVPMILGTVISFLLGFRSNQSYDRWWEARKIWGAIVNDTRTWGRQVVTLIPNINNDPEIQKIQQTLIYRHIAWSYSLGRALRNRGTQLELEKWISEPDINLLSNYTNIPMAILSLQGKDLKLAYENGWVNPYQQIALDESLTKFSTHMGMCERIKNTVFPSTYSLYLLYAMYLFFGLLPFSLIGHVDPWMVIPLETAISAVFWLIEKMSVQLQDPFENRATDTPVTTIAQTLERDLKQILREENVAQPNKPSNTDFYQM